MFATLSRPVGDDEKEVPSKLPAKDRHSESKEEGREEERTPVHGALTQATTRSYSTERARLPFLVSMSSLTGQHSRHHFLQDMHYN